MEFPLVIRAQLPPSNVSQETNFQSRIIKKKKKWSVEVWKNHTHTQVGILSVVFWQIDKQ